MKPARAIRLFPAQIELDGANEFVARVHRHHKPVTGHRISLAVADEGGGIRGVAICGRPVARKTDPRKVLEITRCATDGTPNAPSKLYAMCIQIAKLAGYKKVQTFTLEDEPGTSLKACGFKDDAAFAAYLAEAFKRD